MQTIAALLAVAALIILQGAVDAHDRAIDDAIAYRKWVDDSCVPAHAGESAVATRDGQRLHCTIYSHSGYGLAPIVVSAAVMELPL